MKYSVGDLFLDPIDNCIIEIEDLFYDCDFPYYLVLVGERRSGLRWYDHDFDNILNINCPVLKELYS
jgi:hypothetical protein